MDLHSKSEQTQPHTQSNENKLHSLRCGNILCGTEPNRSLVFSLGGRRFASLFLWRGGCQKISAFGRHGTGEKNVRSTMFIFFLVDEGLVSVGMGAVSTRLPLQCVNV